MNLYMLNNEYELTAQRLTERRQEIMLWRAVRNAQSPSNVWQFLRRFRFPFSKEQFVTRWSPQAAQVDEALSS